VYWLKVKAPAWWLDAYYLATGKRWNDPRISAGKKYAIRYAADEAFYHKEYARLQAKKIRERSQLGRKAGGMSAANTKAIRMAGTHCHYCHTQLELRQRTLDHVVPLIKGGLHQSFNVVVACRSCNSRKGSR
jgi:5-methylcytosine-specific restriction endonuclease McrA